MSLLAKWMVDAIGARADEARLDHIKDEVTDYSRSLKNPSSL